jgi:hypothetical protein
MVDANINTAIRAESGVDELQTESVLSADFPYLIPITTIVDVLRTNVI